MTTFHRAPWFSSVCSMLCAVGCNSCTSASSGRTRVPEGGLDAVVDTPSSDAAMGSIDASSVRDGATIRTDAARASTLAELAVGAAHVMALDADGIYGWGSNAHGQLARPSDQTVLAPQRLSLPVHYRTVAAGGGSQASGHSCGIVEGSVWCWGDNEFGQLGDGSRSSSSTPVQAVGLADAVALSLGNMHSCALRADGTIACWGRGDSGQLGTGKLNDELSPAAVQAVTGASALSVGYYHGCALAKDSVQCWGANSYGEVGRGDRIVAAVPVVVKGLAVVRSVAAGGYASCALLQDGHVSCWGSNEYGQLGIGSGGTGMLETTPASISGLEDVVQLSLGGAHACARTQQGAAWCWGSNALGQLGDGTRTMRTTPTAVAGLSAVALLGAGGGFTVALDGQAGLVAFGADDQGQLGDQLRMARALPGPVPLP